MACSEGGCVPIDEAREVDELGASFRMCRVDMEDACASDVLKRCLFVVVEG